MSPPTASIGNTQTDAEGVLEEVSRYQNFALRLSIYANILQIEATEKQHLADIAQEVAAQAATEAREGEASAQYLARKEHYACTKNAEESEKIRVSLTKDEDICSMHLAASSASTGASTISHCHVLAEAIRQEKAKPSVEQDMEFIENQQRSLEILQKDALSLLGNARKTAEDPYGPAPVKRQPSNFDLETNVLGHRMAEAADRLAWLWEGDREWMTTPNCYVLSFPDESGYYENAQSFLRSKSDGLCGF